MNPPTDSEACGARSGQARRRFSAQTFRCHEATIAATQTGMLADAARKQRVEPCSLLPQGSVGGGNRCKRCGCVAFDRLIHVLKDFVGVGQARLRSPFDRLLLLKGDVKIVIRTKVIIGFGRCQVAEIRVQIAERMFAAKVVAMMASARKAVWWETSRRPASSSKTTHISRAVSI